MGACLTTEWTRTITELQVLLTGLSITGSMAAAIILLGFDPRSLPVPFSLLSPDVVFFLVVVIFMRLSFLAVTILEVLGRDLRAKLLGIDERLESLQRANVVLPQKTSPPRPISHISTDISCHHGLGSDFVPLSATPPRTSIGTSPDLGWPFSDAKQRHRKRTRFTILTELDDSD